MPCWAKARIDDAEVAHLQIYVELLNGCAAWAYGMRGWQEMLQHRKACGGDAYKGRGLGVRVSCVQGVRR